ncbi:uncharacterized protein BO72DRAFT_393114, partial [Aspergillus fijiensis CBS 313.89]
IGNYAAQINQALSEAEQHVDSAHIHESIFHRTGYSNGDITWIAYFGSRCQDDGSGKSDFC